MQSRFLIAITFSVTLLTLQACAHTAIREPASSQDDAPNAIRTLGADQRGAFVHSARDGRSTYSHFRAAAPTAPLARVRWSVLRDQRCGLNFQ
jgi:hypothetical protein